MNRITQTFQHLHQRQAKALMPFVVAGDPDLATTARLLSVLDEAGCAVCELGFPFSDPIADGPVIQDSMAYALKHQVRPGDILDMVKQVRGKLKMALVAMVSYSIVHRLGPREFIANAAAAGMDGFIIPDLPVEESALVRKLIAEAGLTCSFLIAPTTSPERARMIAQACTGFVYVLARAGVTGESAELPADLCARLQELRQATDLPLAVGFGVSSAAQVRQVVAAADAVIVGSAIMRRVVEARAQGGEVVVEQVRRFIVELQSGLPAATPGTK